MFTSGDLCSPRHDLPHVHLLALATGQVIVQRPPAGVLYRWGRVRGRMVRHAQMSDRDKTQQPVCLFTGCFEHSCHLQTDSCQVELCMEDTQTIITVPITTQILCLSAITRHSRVNTQWHRGRGLIKNHKWNQTFITGSEDLHRYSLCHSSGQRAPCAPCDLRPILWIIQQPRGCRVHIHFLESVKIFL